MLWQLINSLSRTEKAYFAKFHRKSGKTNDDDNDFYLRLFDAVAAQGNNKDEAAVRKKMSKYQQTSNFAAAKNYLYEAVLESLCDYHQQQSVDARLYRMLEKIRLLSERALYEQALKIVAKARKMAVEYERLPVLLQLQEWESQLLHFAGHWAQLKTFCHEGFRQDEVLAAQWFFYRQVQKNTVQLFLYFRSYALTRNADDMAQARYFAEQLHTLEKGLHHSVKARLLLCFGLFYYYYFVVSDVARADDYSEKRVQLFHQNPPFLSLNRYSYIHAINAVLITKCALSAAAPFLSYLQHLEQLDCRSPEEKVGVYEVFSQNLLNFLLQGNTINNLEQRLEQLETQYHAYKKQLKPDFKTSIEFLLARFFWENKQWEKALDWLLWVENETQKEDYISHQVAARLMSLIAHYELKNELYLLSATDTVYRYIQREKRLYATERILLHYFKLLLRQNNKSTEKNIFQALSAELTTLQNDAFEQPVFRLFNPIVWVKAKLGE